MKKTSSYVDLIIDQDLGIVDKTTYVNKNIVISKTMLFNRIHAIYRYKLSLLQETNSDFYNRKYADDAKPLFTYESLCNDYKITFLDYSPTAYKFISLYLNKQDIIAYNKGDGIIMNLDNADNIKDIYDIKEKLKNFFMANIDSFKDIVKFSKTLFCREDLYYVLYDYGIIDLLNPNTHNGVIAEYLDFILGPIEIMSEYDYTMLKQTKDCGFIYNYETINYAPGQRTINVDIEVEYTKNAKIKKSKAQLIASVLTGCSSYKYETYGNLTTESFTFDIDNVVTYSKIIDRRFGTKYFRLIMDKNNTTISDNRITCSEYKKLRKDFFNENKSLIKEANILFNLVRFHHDELNKINKIAKISYSTGTTNFL